tara:strand:+ start:2301 stop:2558 length:258 start_codon:yes stop_codon:yes gene_type:complete
MEKPKTIYCGSGKKMGADWLSVTLALDKAKEHFFTYEGKTYVKLNVNIKDKPDQYDKDVSLSVNTYKPPTDEPVVAKTTVEDSPF